MKTVLLNSTSLREEIACCVLKSGAIPKDNGNFLQNSYFYVRLDGTCECLLTDILEAVRNTTRLFQLSCGFYAIKLHGANYYNH